MERNRGAAERTEANGTGVYEQAVGEPLQRDEGSYAGDTGDCVGERIHGMQEMSYVVSRVRGESKKEK